MIPENRIRARGIIEQLLSGAAGEFERLDVEIKGASALDVASYAATIARAVMCLTNHGGGVIVVGFLRDQQAYVEEPISDQALQTWEATRLHDMLRTFMAPAPECELAFEDGTASRHPVIFVPSHGAAPVVCIRDSQVTRRGAVYIRKPGPTCEEPHSPSEWTPLFRRAMQFDREELLSIIRDLIVPLRPEVAPAPDEFAESIRGADSRFLELYRSTPETSGLSFGRWVVAHQLIPPSSAPPSLSQLAEILRRSKGRDTGWPIGVFLDREDVRPHPYGEGIEAWIPSRVLSRGLDYWYAKPTGFFYQTRAFEEDLELQPGATVLDITLPIWRVGEAMRHASRMARNYGTPVERVRFSVRYEGLADRVLWSHRPEIRMDLNRHVCRTDLWSNEIAIPVEFELEDLADLLYQLLTPLYEQFDLFEMPRESYINELRRMIERR